MSMCIHITRITRIVSGCTSQRSYSPKGSDDPSSRRNVYKYYNDELVEVSSDHTSYSKLFVDEVALLDRVGGFLVYI